jgi:uncharacterized protein
MKIAHIALVLLGMGFALAQPTIERQALTIDFGDFQTKAELSLPASSSGALPTIILIPGSGPEDMNATIFGFGPDGQPVKLSSIFKDISDDLNLKGFAALRYNKHYVTGPGQFDVQAFYTKLDLNQMLKDAEKVLEAAKANARVDAKRIYLYGWSEGSTIAASLVTKHPEVAGLIVQGPVALSWRENFLYQVLEVGLPYLRGFATSGGVNDAALQKALAGPGGLVAKGIANYIGDPTAFQMGKIAINPQLDTNKNGTLELETELTPKVFDGVIDAGFSSFFSIYAPGRALPTLIEGAPNLKLPVLVLQGANDANVPMRGTNALETALKTAGNTDVTLKIYAGLGHTLGPASSLSDDNFRPVSRVPLEDLSNWLMAQTKR